MKTKTLTLFYPWPDKDSQAMDRYRVETATDTTEYNPHQLLKKMEVDSLCDANGWKITIKPVKES